MTAESVTSHMIVRRPARTRSRRQSAGRLLLATATILFGLLVVAQLLNAFGILSIGFSGWPAVYLGYTAWSVVLCLSQVLIRGEEGARALFVLPAILFVVGMVIFPTAFGLVISFTDWNLASTNGWRFNGLDNIREMLSDTFFWGALGNMCYYVAGVLVQYLIAFGLALLLNAEIRARKFFRVAFLLPFMLSPVAVSWMLGKSMMEYRFGPMAALARTLGWEDPAFFVHPMLARVFIAALDAWMWIPFMVILLLAGLQAISKELLDAAKVDGATGWQCLTQITFPLMLPVSFTTIFLRIIFQLKLADIVLTLTAGGPGGATDTVSSFIFREYRDRSNVGYGTLLAQVYLIMIVIFLTLMLKLSKRYIRHTV